MQLIKAKLIIANNDQMKKASYLATYSPFRSFTREEWKKLEVIFEDYVLTHEENENTKN